MKYIMETILKTFMSSPLLEEKKYFFYCWHANKWWMKIKLDFSIAFEFDPSKIKRAENFSWKKMARKKWTTQGKGISFPISGAHAWWKSDSVLLTHNLPLEERELSHIRTHSTRQ